MNSIFSRLQARLVLEFGAVNYDRGTVSLEEKVELEESCEGVTSGCEYLPIFRDEYKFIGNQFIESKLIKQFLIGSTRVFQKFLRV